MGHKKILRVHHAIFESRANGPGMRAVIWLQGCSLQCPGCFNPELQAAEEGHEIPVSSLAEQLIAKKPDIEGITVSGGEPLEQIDPLIELLSVIRQKTRLSILLFSGYTLREIETMKGGKNLLSFPDVLVDGPFDKNMASPEGAWPSSANQNIILLTPRYSKADFKEIPAKEILINPNGDIIETGLYHNELLHELKTLSRR